MVPDPGSLFGHLSAGCISDEYEKPERRMAVEGAAFLIMGALSSVLTTYVLSVVGILV